MRSHGPSSLAPSENGEHIQEKAEKVHKRREQRCEIGQRRGGEDLLCRGQLVLRDHARGEEHFPGAAGGVQLHGQRDEREEERPAVEHNAGHGDIKARVGVCRADVGVEQDTDEHERHGEPRAEIHDRHERRAQPVGAVALLVLHHVADLVRGDRHGGDGAAVRGACGKIHDAPVRGVVVGQLAGNAAESDVGHAVHAQQPLGGVAPGETAAAGQTAVRGIRALYLTARDHRKHHAREQGEKENKIVLQIHEKLLSYRRSMRPEYQPETPFFLIQYPRSVSRTMRITSPGATAGR